jgi:hypothetical protein
VVHGIDTEIIQVVQLAKRPRLTSYLKWVSLIFLPVTVPGAIQLDDPLVTQALNGLPNINRLDVLTPYTWKLPACSKFSSDLHIPQLIQLTISNIAVDTENLAAFMMKHDNIRSVDLGAIRVYSGSYTDILDSAYRLPRLRKFILNRSSGRRVCYDMTKLGSWSGDDYEISLASFKATVVATEPVQMRHAISVLSKLYLKSVDRSAVDLSSG